MSDPMIPAQTSCADPEPPQTLKVREARELILGAARPLPGRERLALRDALGRFLAEDVISPVNVPGHTNSAMDGYALAGTNLPAADALDYRVIGSAFAGEPFTATCKAGACVRIMTGAPMPAGTDTVVMQEQVLNLGQERVRIGAGHRPGQNVRQAGEDIRAGGRVLNAGRRITPADLGILASLGFGEIPVRRRPRVAFFSTGNELRSIGEPLGEGEVYDSNRYSLYGMLSRLGVEILDMGVVVDDPDSLREAFSSAAAMADLVISSGGVSVGEADYTKRVLEEQGEMNFWKIAMKPGRPLAFGQLGDALFFGLPGNPVAVMVTFYQFVLPALYLLASGEPYQPFQLQAVCSDPIRKKPGRYEFLRGILTTSEDGSPLVSGVGKQGSGILTSMSRGNCFIHLPEACDGVVAGEMVTVEPFLGYL